MVHAAMAEVEPGEVLVLTMPEPRPVALVGDLLATQAKAHGAAAILVDASVRDVEELAELGLPIWARWVRVHGAVKETPGTIGDAGDASVGRRSGRATCWCSTPTVSRSSSRAGRRGARGVARARRRGARQARSSSQDGALSFDLDGLRAKLEGDR